jgi:phosphoribosyl 1,2-cyclic phosphodiesterase
MKLKILGSSSKANGYLLESNNTGGTLLIEAGIRLSTVNRNLANGLTDLKGVLLTHQHQDHAKYVEEYLKAGIDVYSSQETFENLCVGSHRAIPVIEKKKFVVKEFTVMAFPLIHDVKCLGYVIQHNESGNILFATDTLWIPFNIKGLNNIIIEANYDINIVNANVESGKTHPIVRKRVMKSHMEVSSTKLFLTNNDLSKVNNIILIHLSDSGSNEKAFMSDIETLTGKTVHVAKRGMEISIDKTPF